jgi:HD-like signal output (HDOD) protein
LLSNELRTSLEEVRDLPSPPKLAMELVEIAEQPDISLAAVAAVIDQDPALSAKLLRVANSPLYTRQRKRETLRQAILALGLNGTLTLSLSFSLVSGMRDAEPESGVNYGAFWRRSLMAGTAARALADMARLDCGEQVFLAALLQDIGILALDRVNPQFYADAPDLLSDHRGLAAYEAQHLCSDHTEVGGWLLDRWHMSDPVCEAVRTSHNAGQIAPDYAMAGFSQCVALSGDFADVWFMDDPHQPMYDLAIAAEQLLGITPGDLLEVFSLLREQLADTEAVFEVSIADSEHVERITAQAKKLLSAQELVPPRAAAGTPEAAGKAVRSLAELESLITTEFVVAQRRRWPLSVAAIRLAPGTVARSDAMAAAMRARAALSDTADIACLDDARLLVLFSGVDADTAETTSRALLTTLAEDAHGTAFERDGILAGLATLDTETSYSSAENLIRSAYGALHAAIRDPAATAIVRATGEEEAIALGTQLESFTAEAAAGGRRGA